MSIPPGRVLWWVVGLLYVRGLHWIKTPPDGFSG